MRVTDAEADAYEAFELSQTRWRSFTSREAGEAWLGVLLARMRRYQGLDVQLPACRLRFRNGSMLG